MFIRIPVLISIGTSADNISIPYLPIPATNYLRNLRIEKCCYQCSTALAVKLLLIVTTITKITF